MPIDHAFYALGLTLCSLLMRMTGLVRVHVGKGRQHHMSIMQVQGARRVCALRTLVMQVI